MDDFLCVELAEYCLSDTNTQGEAESRWGELTEKQKDEVLEVIERLKLIERLNYYNPKNF